MNRNAKGHSVHEHVDNYCIVDLETTGIFVSSARIIEISALKIRNNEIVDEFSTLINPGCPIPADATAINNITNEMVKDSPSIDEVLDSFIAFIGNDVIVGYNNAGFDMNLIYDVLDELRGTAFSNNYIDLLHASRRCILEAENYKLETISRHYSLDTTGEHRALKDCHLTKAVYDNLYKDFGDDAFCPKDSRVRHTFHYSAETLALQNLQSLLEIIIEDGEVTHIEFSTLKAWMEDHRDLQGNYPFDRVFNALDKVLEDGKVTPEELCELQLLFSDFVDPVKNRGSHNEITSISNKHIVVTGDFNYGDRNEVCALIEAAGGINDKNVKKATNYVVVGAKGSSNWKTGNYGGKIQKALELKDKGYSIEIVEEDNFIPAVQKIIKNNAANEMNANNDSLKETDWKVSVRKMLEALIEEYELPARSLYLSDNYGQTTLTKDTLISHSVYIWEPDYPSTPNEKQGKNKLVITIVPSKVKNRPDDLDLNIRELQEGDLHNFLPEDAEVLAQTKSDKISGTIRVRMNQTSPYLTEYIRKNTIYCIKGYVSKAARFGCCSSFMQCSDAKKCVHVNKLYSTACMYRDNLNQGRIFYGKNRNID